MAERLGLDASEVMALLAETFPQAGSNFEIARLSPRRVLLWSSTSEGQLRPGATVSGPAQFGLLDLAAYVLVLANVGRAELAVTSHASINFLARPRVGPIAVTGELLKLGRSLVVTACSLWRPRPGQSEAPGLAAPGGGDGGWPDPDEGWVRLASGEFTYSLVLVTS